MTFRKRSLVVDFDLPDNFEQLSSEDKKAFLRNQEQFYEYKEPINKLHDILLGDLAIRETNLQTGSGLGGNPSQLFYLLSKRLVFRSTTEAGVSFSQKGDRLMIEVTNTLLEDLKADRHFDLGLVRKALTDHYSLLPEVHEVTFSQLTDPVWVEAQSPLTPALKVYLSYLKKILNFKRGLVHKAAVLEKFEVIRQEEEDVIIKDYLNEIGLTEVEASVCDLYLLDDSYNKHPVFGELLKQISERESKIMTALFCDAERSLLKTINVMPSYLSILTMRLVSIDNLIRYNLDDFVNNEKFSNAKIKKSEDVFELDCLETQEYEDN